ncbi:GNAT family N-acetyltransferase [Saccharicrinis sp. GN24d3]|uniref:GNAT family N-acetyltransferase n=1 Tax=Saccharicrinis sp. GN24d3 TaxID=3458416 RepID=UPI0040353CEC
MDIVDLSDKTRGDYFTCLEEWSDEMKDGICRKECWYNTMAKKGLRVKLARNDAGIIAGMIHYAPIEHSWIEGENLYFVYCIWVHGHKRGRGDLRKRGVGKALLRAAEEDVKNLKAKGLVVWGLILPFFMRAGWFKKHGYKKADRKGISVLLWKTFTENASPPQWIRAKKKPKPIPGKVVVTALSNGWCSGINGMIERAKQISGEFGDQVIFREIDMNSRAAVREWGLSDGLFIDDRNIYKGPPLSSEKIRKIISRKVKKLK